MDPVAAIARSWWVVLLAVLVGATAVASVVATRPERFTSTATLLYSAGDPGDDLIGGGAADPIRTLNTQVQLVTSDPVVVPAAELLALDPGALRASLAVALAPDSSVLQIRGSAETAQDAQRMVTTVSDAYISYNRELGVDKLLARADGLSTTAASLNTRLTALPTVPAAAADPRQVAFAAQIVALAQQEDQLRTAAASYPGPLSVLSVADLPARPSSLGVVGGAGIGGGLGLALGLLLTLLRMPRGTSPPLAGATRVPPARHYGVEHASPFAEHRAS